MATIKINDITFREACCNWADEDAYAMYDANVERIMQIIGDKARAAGHEFYVLPNATGAASYTVSTDDYTDAESAHDFMQSDEADFFRYL